MKTLTKSERGWVVELTTREYRTLIALDEALKGFEWARWGNFNDDRPQTEEHDYHDAFEAIRRWVENKFHINAIEASMKAARAAMGESEHET